MGNTARHILVLNAGSSSLKVGLFDWDSATALADKNIAWHTESDSPIRSHSAALRHVLADIPLERISAVGHRVVHGGTRYRESVRVDAGVKQGIADLAALAPLHNPAALAGIAAGEEIVPGIPQVAAFDTAFHATLPPSAYMYGVPYEWYAQWGVRRFGFHGLSHAYCADRAAAMLGRSLTSLKIVTCHLGQGCSLAAIASGRSIATTMGFTPLDGLMMGTRAGAIDPGLLLYVLEKKGLTAQELDHVLTDESGLKGISGISSDMRDILRAREEGTERADLAFQMFIARVQEGIGAMVAALGGVHALVFSGGIGEHSTEVRAAVVQSMGWLGIKLDDALNATAGPDTDVTLPSSRVRVLVIHTREELMVARETRRVLEGYPG